MSSYPQFSAFRSLMEAEQLPQRLIDTFEAQYTRFRAGDDGKIPWAEIEAPVASDLVDHESLAEVDSARQRELLGGLVCVKLNGGLGTTMELDRAKSLIEVRQGQSFLRLIALHVERLRRAHGVDTPLLLMNSFRTSEDSRRELATFSQPDVPLDFLQHKVPRIDAETHLPAELSGAERWSPPGHGDIYLAMFLSGVLKNLVGRGYRWAFVSNADNLGATVDLRILDHLERQGVDIAMEVTPKTLADRKGGTLVRRGERLTLLERIQVEPAHLDDFEDIDRFAVFNTNSLWWRLDVMLDKIEQGDLDLPLIVNPKQQGGRKIVQLETAMGAAIGAFSNALGVRVSRQRFAPVKASCDLLGVRSDAYVVDELGGLRPNPLRPVDWGPPVIELDDRYYKGVPGLEERFEAVPSLLMCRRLKVEGDVRFAPGVVIEGDVTLRNLSGQPQCVPAGTTLADTTKSWD